MSDDNNNNDNDNTPYFRSNNNAIGDAAKQTMRDGYVLYHDARAKFNGKRYNPQTDKDEEDV
jgi:hypothetical protein